VAATQCDHASVVTGRAVDAVSEVALVHRFSVMQHNHMLGEH